MSSSRTSWALRMDTNECRSSRGVHSPPSRAALAIFWNSFARASGPAACRPRGRTRDRALATSPPPPRAVRRPGGCGGAERLDGPGGQLQHAPALGGLGVALDPNRAVDGDWAGLQVGLVPDERLRLLGADTGEQGQHHVGREPVAAGLDGLREHDGLVQRHRLGRPPFLPFGHVDQAGHVAADLIAGLGLGRRLDSWSGKLPDCLDDQCAVTVGRVSGPGSLRSAAATCSPARGRARGFRPRRSRSGRARPASRTCGAPPADTKTRSPVGARQRTMAAAAERAW